MIHSMTRICLRGVAVWQLTSSATAAKGIEQGVTDYYLKQPMTNWTNTLTFCKWLRLGSILKLLLAFYWTQDSKRLSRISACKTWSCKRHRRRNSLSFSELQSILNGSKKRWMSSLQAMTRLTCRLFKLSSHSSDSKVQKTRVIQSCKMLSVQVRTTSVRYQWDS